jgi:hypothetical protein
MNEIMAAERPGSGTPVNDNRLSTGLRFRRCLQPACQPYLQVTFPVSSMEKNFDVGEIESSGSLSDGKS